MDSSKTRASTARRLVIGLGVVALAVTVTAPAVSAAGAKTKLASRVNGGGFGLGNRLTTFSATLQMSQFFAVILILSILGILIYVTFFLIGKKWASWEA